ncbi:MAG: GNAT family N-acetyltransferase [Frankia sp.]
MSGTSGAGLQIGGAAVATIRRAGPADAAELTRLREVMFASSIPARVADDWQLDCIRVLADRLAHERDTFVAVVAEDTERPGRLLACGVAWVDVHLPSPGNPAGTRGHIANISTDPSARRQGLARAVMEELLAFFAERRIDRVELFATAMGEGVYRSLGFADRAHGRAMSWEPVTPDR